MPRHRSPQFSLVIAPGAIAIVLVAALVFFLQGQFGQDLFTHAFEGVISLLIVLTMVFGALVCIAIAVYRFAYRWKRPRRLRPVRTLPRLAQRLSAAVERRDTSAAMQHGKLLARVGGETAAKAWTEWRAFQLTMVLGALLIALSTELIMYRQYGVAQEQRDLLAEQNQNFQRQIDQFNEQLRHSNRHLEMEEERRTDRILYTPEATQVAPPTRVRALNDLITAPRPQSTAGSATPIEIVGVNLESLVFAPDRDVTWEFAFFRDAQLRECTFRGVRMNRVMFFHSLERLRDPQTGEERLPRREQLPAIDAGFLTFEGCTLRNCVVPAELRHYERLVLTTCVLAGTSIGADYVWASSCDFEPGQFERNGNTVDRLCQVRSRCARLSECTGQFTVMPTAGASGPTVEFRKLGASSGSLIEVEYRTEGGRDTSTSEANSIEATVKLKGVSADELYINLNGTSSGLKLDFENVKLGRSVALPTPPRGTLRDIQDPSPNNRLWAVTDWSNCEADKEFCDWYAENCPSTPEKAPKPFQ